MEPLQPGADGMIVALGKLASSTEREKWKKPCREGGNSPATQLDEVNH